MVEAVCQKSDPSVLYSKFLPCPSSLLHLERRLHHSLWKVPFNTFARDQPCSLSYYNIPSVQSLSVLSMAIRARFAHKHAASIDSLYSSIVSTASAHSSLSGLPSNRLHPPWLQLPAVILLHTSTPTALASTAQVDLAVQPKVQRFWLSVFSDLFPPPSILSLARRRLRGLGLSVSVDDITQSLLCAGSVSSFSACIHLKTWLNAWNTQRRYSQVRPCIFCASFTDSLSHILFCDVLWSSLASQFCCNLPFSHLSRLGLHLPSPLSVRLLTAAFRVYHSLRKRLSVPREALIGAVQAFRT